MLYSVHIWVRIRLGVYLLLLAIHTQNIVLLSFFPVHIVHGEQHFRLHYLQCMCMNYIIVLFPNALYLQIHWGLFNCNHLTN